ncbi:Octanoyltransferase [Rubrivivax sp. A210]|uniref:lipoyl(octanoyl) transferase LipB n=1 Tax=Rubrivivax sp. A210 TaxID=2772301 RepID=UPI0019186833|nr:lipoyl(octanoyl) transferase LipB [Rubrivivax sp. A210]CAD5369086.1 Octanoyltransferase [Rubrivivax sp. A210]
MQIRRLGQRPYAEVETAMRDFTRTRHEATEDELWLVEHEPVYTQGVAGRADHVLNPGSIPVLRTDRGGQVTYHGPGQVVAYPLLDLRRLAIYVKEYVFRIEQAVIDTLLDFGVTGHRVRSAPGIYVRLDDPCGHAVLVPEAGDPFKGLGKIAALGIKVSNHRSWHGVALNVAMDLEPYRRINPCGYAGLATVDLRAVGVEVSWDEAAARLATRLASRLGD